MILNIFVVMIIEVQTTQNVTIDYKTAGVGKRMLAYILDWVFIILWLAGWFWILSLITRFGFRDLLDGDVSSIALFFVFISPAIFYDFLFEIFNNGQSLGKMIFKIRVVNTDGTAPSTGSYLIRWLFRLIDFTITYNVLAIIMVNTTKKSQRLGDLLAGTTVIDMNLKADLSITDLDFRTDYKVAFPDVLDHLSDRDMRTIVSILDDQRFIGDDYFYKRLADRIKTITGYTYDGSDGVFLRKIISDYNFLAVQEL